MKSFQSYITEGVGFRLVAKWDVRPFDPDLEIRVPVPLDNMPNCMRCGRKHNIVYQVQDMKTGNDYEVGSGCMRQAFGGWEPGKDEIRKVDADWKLKQKKAVEDKKREIINDVITFASKIQIGNIIGLEYVKPGMSRKTLTLAKPENYAQAKQDLIRTGGNIARGAIWRTNSPTEYDIKDLIWANFYENPIDKYLHSKYLTLFDRSKKRSFSVYDILTAVKYEMLNHIHPQVKFETINADV